MKKIGKVNLDYTYYKGNDLYSDGRIEDELLEACKNGTCEELLYNSNQWPVLYHLSNIRENLLEWYPFSKDADILEIGSGCGAITGILSKNAKTVTCIELSEKRSLINAYRHEECDNIKIMIGNFQDIEPHIEKYDYITLIGVWEYSGLYINGNNPYLEMLNIAKKHLKQNGRIIIAIENKMGLKYWNGAVEDHTGQLYSGLNDYVGDGSESVRTFSKVEIEELFKKADLDKYVFYYPMPDYKLPDVIYSEKMLPMPGMERNYGKDYNAARIYNCNDAIVTDQICADKMFSYFANSFLVVIGEDKEQICYAKYNRCRKEEFRIKTEVIPQNDSIIVKKGALSDAAGIHILEIKENEEICKSSLNSIQYVQGDIEDNTYITQFVSGIDLEALFYEYRNNIKEFIKKFKHFINIIFRENEMELVDFAISEEFINIFGTCKPDNKKCLKSTNVDLIFSNMKLIPSGDIYCFDYEWVFDFLIPYEYMIWRMAHYLYEKYRAYLMWDISKAEFLNQVGISKDDSDVYESMEKHFLAYVYGEYRKEDYVKNYRKSALLQATKIR